MSLDISTLQVSITIIKVINISHHLPVSLCLFFVFWGRYNYNSYFKDEETSNLAKKKCSLFGIKQLRLNVSQTFCPWAKTRHSRLNHMKFPIFIFYLQKQQFHMFKLTHFTFYINTFTLPNIQNTYIHIYTHLCMLSHFSCVSQLFATLWTVPSRLLCPWGSPGKKNGVGHHASSRGSSPLREWTCISCLLHCQVGSSPLAPPGKLIYTHTEYKYSDMYMYVYI